MNRLHTVPLLLTFLLVPVASTHAQPSAEAVAFFENKIRPLLADHCYECHSVQAKKRKGGLLLDSREALLKGGDSGPGLVPGDPEKSLLIIAVRHTDKDLRMPPKAKLSPGQIADLETWVKTGAVDPRTGDPGKVVSAPSKYGMSLEEGRKFWSLLPIKDAVPPKVKNDTWLRTGVDAFILQRQENANVVPAADADKRTLLRRVTFDLIGLPPTPAEMDDFLADTAPNAFEKVVDRLLASPRYGERWGRHWLDVVRYADTCGNASDYPIPQAHRYRDWVIRAFNRDLPYDQFLREQIAGDLMESKTDAERSERIVATGYLAISKRFGGDRFGEHHLTIEDTIDNLGRTILGFSISCARCHDHKFDPFTQSDYYGLYGILSSTRYPFPGAEVKKEQEDFVPLKSADAEVLLKAHNAAIDALTAEMKKLDAAEAEVKKTPATPERAAKLNEIVKTYNEVVKKKNAMRNSPPPLPTAYAVGEAKAMNVKVHLRGDPKRLGDEVQRHFPAVLGGQTLPKDFTSSGRMELASWLTDSKNPLTARVMVNRIWQHHFGKGIVHTPNDFGKQGKAPTHPELLDYLAARFIESGWSVKAMHKLILLSHTWQLASDDVAENMKHDPNNELHWKHTRRRLEAEAIRDSMLFVSGDLDETPAGAHPFPAMNTWKFTQHAPFVAVYESRQRSVYLMQQRIRKNPYLALFDGADPSSSTGVRLPSTTPLQALFLMNDPFAHREATKFAERIMAADKDATARIAFAYRLALTRTPTAEEQSECNAFLTSYRAKLVDLKTPADQLETRTWSALARAILSGNEFIFVD